MRLLGFGFLIVFLLASAQMAITVADAVEGLAPDPMQSLPQPVPAAEQDLLNLLD